eukprot:TRINITY_DN4043_c0_g1_i2.p1 TRINITY_DN4043_c0_g1~~TRINITY_DN4043_c0_g1_i2.p1  ORF type:complete len:269 (-),score=40.87 TRINITY_DN4043_c0_g1_i2:1021-1827(-)
MRSVVVVLLLVAFVSAAPEGKWFDRIFIMMFENQAYSSVINDPNFLHFAQEGQLFTRYSAVTHPSQPNYWSMTSGSYYGINSDNPHNLTETNIVDLLEAKSVSWKAYMEGYPGNCFTGKTSGRYARKHNPFISYMNIQTNPARCAHIVNAQELDSDLASGNLAEYMYYTPNMDDDGHDTGLAYAGRFLSSFLTPRLPKFPPKTLIVITWDEDDNLHNNHIYTVLLGSTIKPGTRVATQHNHYSLLRTVEDNWSLGTLGRNDTTATPYF